MRIIHPKTLLLSLLAFALVAFIWPTRAFALSPDALLGLTNQQRVTAGLQPLHANTELAASATAKAQDMITRDYWAHFAPDGTSPWYFISQSGYKYTRAGENLAMDFGTDQAVMDGWMNSPTHRANILNPYYVDVGFAVVEGQLQGHDTLLVVAHYGAPAEAPTPAPAPAPVTQPASSPAPVVVVASFSQPQTKTAAPAPIVASKHTAKPSADSKNVAFLMVGMSQMWLTPLFKYRSLG